MNKEIAERIELIKKEICPFDYQKQESYIVPKSWSVINFGKLASLKNGLNYGKDEIGEKIKIVGVGDFKSNFYIKVRELSYINYENLDEEYLLKKGDMLFVRSNGNKELIGRVMFCNENIEATTFSGFTIRARIQVEGVIPVYIAYYFSSDIVKKQYMQKGGGTNISNLSQGILNDIPVIVPKKEEQEKIIQVLQIWDKAISLKEQLVKEKEKQNSIAIEKLVNIKKGKRLKLGDLMTEVNEKSVINNQHDILSVTKEGIFLQSEYFNRQIASEDNTGYKVVKKNNLVFSTMNLWMGSIDVLEEYEVGIVSPACKVFEFKESAVDVAYMKYFMKSKYMMNLYKINSEQGASVVRRNLDLKGLLSSRVIIPELSEQRRIGIMLNTFNKEVALLKKEIEALKKQKQGLMQLLLTGIVRVNK